ncbi:MAG: N-acetyltransferase [Anaerolineae bacterium]|nr:N-acetyltransferase [Anaerolineae bacterium]
MSDIDLNALRVVNNSTHQRYEIALGDAIAFAEYHLSGRTIIFTHTEVPSIFEGKGVGGKLAKGAIEDAIAQGYRIEPQCPFIAAYIKRHPEYQPHTRGY